MRTIILHGSGQVLNGFLLLLLGMAVRGTCRRCLMILLFLLALAAFPHRDLTMFALGGLAVWCLMPGRDSGKKGPSGRS